MVRSDGLTFGGVTDLTFATVDECDDGGSCVTAFGVRDYDGILAFKDGYARVGGA